MEESIKKFKKGTKYLKIASSVTSKELTTSDHITDDYMEMKCVKFIPASGAATRMFKDLYKYLENGVETDYIKKFFNELEKFAFYEDIKEYIENKNIDKNTTDGKIKIINYILKDKLKYGSLPKALIKMNSYIDFSTTPIDEHLFEGQEYLNNNNLNFHFTISKFHEELFNKYTEKILKKNKNIKITYSFQKNY
ncbi:MAG: DUF4301 family protein [Bacillota bacterium]|nr:DUF4301 family protein [Bacillota bacterium]